jgi:hypothetical protein
MTSTTNIDLLITAPLGSGDGEDFEVSQNSQEFEEFSQGGNVNK